MAHYVVQTGMLQEKGYSALLLPPENAALFANAGWTKADIREAVYERTRRSVAWLKQEVWKVTMHRNRLEPVEPGDDDRFRQKLLQNIPRPRTRRHTDTNLARPLRHAHQHDVHDADTADEQRNCSH